MMAAEGIITQEDLGRAVAQQAEKGGTVDSYLVRNGAISSQELVRFLVRRFPVLYWSSARLMEISPQIIERIHPTMAKRFRLIPLETRGGKLVVGMTDPSAQHTIEEVSKKVGCDLDAVVVSNDDMDAALERFYPHMESNQKYLKESFAVEQYEEEGEPIPLVNRITKVFGEYEGSYEPSNEAATIEDALMAIPLVTRKGKKNASEPPPRESQPLTTETTPRIKYSQLREKHEELKRRRFVE